jgi:3-oxo-5-alpha-steroid 4-dehydrogenase 1
MSQMDTEFYMISIGVVVFVALHYIEAPYGKFSPQVNKWTIWGPQIPARWAWLGMESPSLYMSILTFLRYADTEHKSAAGIYLLFAMFLIHYVQRAIIFPFLLTSKRPMPLSVCLMSFIFCVCNGGMQGYAFAKLMPPLSIFEVLAPLRVFGMVLWFIGFLSNLHADRILRNLRKSSKAEYSIPYGGLFRYCSAANYTAEFIEWIGYGLACQSMAAWAFAVFTFCNLAPRARSYHSWYLQKFDDYPKERTAFIPFIY